MSDPADLVDARATGEHKPVVLVVDDEALVRNMVTTILQRKGYAVLAAVDGLDALALSRSYPGNIDLVITDLDMPRLDGVELLKKLFEERPGTRSIVMSGSERDIVIRDHVLPFLSKPFDIEALLSKIRETGCCEEAVAW
jgi:CheY-like chemotaxis protein